MESRKLTFQKHTTFNVIMQQNVKTGLDCQQHYNAEKKTYDTITAYDVTITAEIMFTVHNLEN